MTTHTAITDYYAGADLDEGSLLCHRTTDATVKTASVTDEINAGGGVYSAVFSDVAAGRYRLKLLAGGEVVATRDVEFEGTNNEFVETGYAVLNTAGQTEIAAAVDVKLTAEHGAGSWGGGGSGGDNAEVLDAIDSMKSLIAEWIALNIPSDVRGFPTTIIGGTDIEVSIEVVDSNNDPITEIFGESVESVQWLFGMGTSARRARILGSVEWTSDDLLLISMAKADTLSEDDGPRTWMIGVKLTSGELKWVKTGVTRLIGRQFAEPTTTTTGA